MKLRTKRWSLRLLTVATLAGAVLVVASGQMDAGTDNVEGKMRAGDVKNVSPSSPEADRKLDFAGVWDKRLQQVLFDPPPPPPKVEVKPPPPPLQEKLLGTMINADDAQAIIQDAQQNVHFRRVGEAISPGSPEAMIEKILPSSIEIRRGEDLTTLQME